MNFTARIAAVLLLALVTACAAAPKDSRPLGSDGNGPLTIDPSLAGSKRKTGSMAVPAPTVSNTTATIAAAMPPVETVPMPIAGVETVAPEPVLPTPLPALQIPVEPAPSTAATPPAHPVIAVPTQKITPPVTVKKTAPTLDMAALKLRLRDTNGIGVFTKLSLKNQVDDLMNQFRTRYLDGKTANVSSLRQPYDMLVMKVLALVQDSDPPLARDISGSREAIWGLLADPEKFNTIL